MRTADWYIVRELLPPFLLGIGGFLVILIGDILYTLAEYIVVGRITLEVTLKLLAYKMPAIMVVTFPVSTLFATLLGLSRLARDHELQALRLVGVSLPRIFAPALAFGLLVAGATFLTNEVISPWANRRANDLIRRAILGEAFPAVREQAFLRAPGNRFLYVHQVDNRTGVLRNVMIYEAVGPIPRLITAKQASWSAKTWILREGIVREFDAEGYTSAEAKFASMELNVGLDATSFAADQKTPEEMTVAELRKHVVRFGTGISPRVAIEYHRKFAIPSASLIFALIAAPLSLQAVRGGRFVGVGLCVLLLFVYYAVMSSARALGSAGVLSAFMAAWVPNLLFLAAGFVMIALEDGRIRRPIAALRLRTAGARP
ncbi:MAG: LptF/LptG family permease [Armatimonadota bacterium]